MRANSLWLDDNRRGVHRAAVVIAIRSMLAVALLSAPARADIYTYTDADGTVHFTNTPGPDKRYRLYIRGNGWQKPGPAPGVVPVAPSDHDIVRYTRYDEWIHAAATLYQIPEQLVRAVIRCESDYDPRAVSVSGARGLMQLMPDTASLMQVRDIDDPRENIFGGVRLLRILANEFNGDLELTVAAYNAGDGAVIRFGGIPPFAQTRDYVGNVTRFYRRYRSMVDAVEASVSRD
ncbi:MAG: lytic transglycosylase domain-containing protein [Myxococcota bacterium]|nr:lytic transglycosylase domain-containing protein [Myxococcota bacterium]